VLLSTDGQNWTNHSAPKLGSVVYGNGRFVAPELTPNRRLYYSSDGTAWTSIDLPETGLQLTSLYFVGDRFLALSRSGRIATSTDGVTWSMSSAGTQPLLCVAFGNGRFVIVGSSGSVFTSVDGVTWQPRSAATNADLRSVTFTIGKFDAITADGVLLSSVDGSTWNREEVVTSDNWLTLRFGQTLSAAGNRFLGGAPTSNGYAYNSTDMTHWSPGLTGLARVISVNGVLVGINVTTSVAVSGSSVTVNATGGGQVYRALVEPETPVITTPPNPQSVVAGQSLRLSVTAAGPGPLSYQWLKNGLSLPGQTAATLTLDSVQPADAGSYVVIVTNARGSVGSTPVTVAVASPIAPVITTHPTNLAVNAGATATFMVAATGTGPLSYIWRRNGAPIAGATLATYTLLNVQPADSGDYSVVVSNSVGNITSPAAHLSVTPAGIAAGHTLATGGYIAGATITIANTITYMGDAPGLDWQVLLPDGWSIASSVGDADSVKPAAGSTSLLEWHWTTLPPSPVNFGYTLNIPPAAGGTFSIAALVTRHLLGASQDFLALPDPLQIPPLRHSADTDGNNRISLLELTRVIELYNTRHATTRTGGYRIEPSGEDGFATDATRVAGSAGILAVYHSADTNRDGFLNLLELTRVIELYNTRSGTSRTGQYHVQNGSEDGFGPGP
jgi:hypothetical protein